MVIDQNFVLQWLSWKNKIILYFANNAMQLYWKFEDLNPKLYIIPVSLWKIDLKFLNFSHGLICFTNFNSKNTISLVNVISTSDTSYLNDN